MEDKRFIKSLKSEHPDFNINNIDLIKFIYKDCTIDNKIYYSKIKKNIVKWRKKLNLKNLQKHHKNYWINNGKNQSKEEIDFFLYIKEEDTNIKHIPFFICIKNGKVIKRYVYDGYYKSDNELILLEYDGLYYHNKENDDNRDNNVFINRDDITGIIRISDKYYKKNKQKIKQEIYESIKTIKNKECKKIRLY